MTNFRAPKTNAKLQKAEARPSHRLKFLTFVLAIGIIAGGYWWWNRRSPCDKTEIASGIQYQCVDLTPTSEGSGLMHIVCVDLNVPGVTLYVTPPDSQAQAASYQHRLKYTKDAVCENNLIAAVNATMYGSNSGWIRQRGDYAKTSETVIVEHEVLLADPDSYAIWFEDDLTPHLHATKPIDPKLIPKMRFAIGTQEVVLRNGKPREGTSISCDKRTMLAIDTDHRIMWLIIFESASYHRAAEEAARLGARDGIMLDGGTSTAMAIGPKARNIRPGVLLGDWRPVAVHLGVKSAD